MAQLDSYLARKAGVLAQRRLDFTDAPEKALVRLTASAYCAGTTGVRPTKMGEYTVISDSAPGLAGHSLGPTSPEMVLGALASCLVHTYLLQATLMNIPLDTVTVEINGALDMTGVVGLPIDGQILMQDMSYTPIVESPAPADQIAALHDAVEASCAVLNTLRNPIDVARRMPEAAIESTAEVESTAEPETMHDTPNP